MHGSSQSIEPLTEQAFLELCHARLYPAMLRAGIQKKIRQVFQKIIGRPLENFMLKLWLKNTSAGKLLEKMGLPRRSIEEHYRSCLTNEVDPNSLTTLVTFKNKYQRRRLGNRFIWDGDWDKSVKHFYGTERYRFLEDIWENREDLTKSRRFQELVERHRRGNPYRSYHKGVYLDDDQKVHRFLQIYLTFMKQLEHGGYNSLLATDPVGVALDRRGQLIKINKGLHRLAMAQVVGLKKIPVCIRSVHRMWWDKHRKPNIKLGTDLFLLLSKRV
ncbi:MAG: hypothetical protein D5R98_09720 [Desulfonatronovibrio sp. MSAO_Bac4]|nr:MAG: hypothetical protein D5R98_09720 [Desulfonatronovibrio sp. MSAO_Bac4]